MKTDVGQVVWNWYADRYGPSFSPTMSEIRPFGIRPTFDLQVIDSLFSPVNNLLLPEKDGVLKSGPSFLK